MNEYGLSHQNGALTRAKPKVYLDTTVFSALLSREDDKWKMARDILSDGREGRIGVVVSALTLVECDVPNSASGTDVLADFFESEWIVRCNVDPFVADTARRLRDGIGSTSALTPTGWIHAATALWEGCHYLMSYDRRLLKVNGHKAMEAIHILSPSRPWDTGQMSLVDIEGVMPENSAGSLRRSLIV